MTVSGSAPWWQDWPKFAPGWLALALTLWAFIRGWLIRRHKLAIGPDEDQVRERLTSCREHFRELSSEGRRKDWFASAEPKAVAASLRDHAERRGDKPLRESLLTVATTWEQAADLAPPASGAWVAFEGQEPSPREMRKSAGERTQFTKQAELARKGVEQVGVALARLNYLEQRTTGRS